MTRLDQALGASLLALCGVVTLELVQADRRLPAPVSAPAVPTSAPESLAGAEPVAAYVQQILARPLFTQGRRPEATAASPAAPAHTEPPPRLSGILVTASDRRAIFESGGKAVVGVVGSQMGAYRVLAITPTAVTLLGPAGAVTMTLAFGARPTDATPAPASIIDQLNSANRPPPAMPKTPTLDEMMANLPKTMPPMVNGIPRN